jgi:16S rRNA (adenine1518-N6/adenine1519-N6)-dimethyltransferase
LVRRGFAQRRKQLAKQMPQTRTWSEIAEQLEIPATSRAEELSLEQWVELTRAYDDHPLKDLPQSADELFDVVDAEDQPVSVATRSEVHQAKHLHRAVHVFVFNPRGELLIQQRSMLKDEHPGVWGSSVSGHLNAGESYHEAAQRELEEEMGIITDEPPKEILQLAANEQTGMEHLRVFRITYHGKIRFPASEVQSAIWMPICELIAWMNSQPDDFSPGFSLCFKAAFANSSATS